MKNLFLLVFICLVSLGVTSCFIFPKYPKSIKNPEIKFSAGYNPDPDNVLKKNGYYISSAHANALYGDGSGVETVTDMMYFYPDGTGYSRLYRGGMMGEVFGIYKVVDSVVYINDYIENQGLPNAPYQCVPKVLYIKGDSLIEQFTDEILDGLWAAGFLDIDNGYKFVPCDSIPPLPDSPIKKWKWMNE